MPQPAQVREAHVRAVVQEILPAIGLAYLTDERAGSWAVTKSTPGCGLMQLQPGQQVDLTVAHHDDFSVVSAYVPLD